MAVGYSDTYAISAGVRPVVVLPSDTSCSYVDGVWTIEK